MFSTERSGIVRRVVATGLAIVGGLVLVLFILSLIRVGPGRPAASGGLLAALGVVFSREETFTVRAEPSEIASGGVLHLSWIHETRRQGSYRLSLTCPPGIEVRQVNRGSKICNAETAVNPDQFLLLAATNQNAEAADFRFNVIFEAERGAQNRFSGAFAVVNVRPAPRLTPVPVPPRVQAPPMFPPRPLPAPAPSPQPQPSTPPGPRLPDFSVRIIDVGTTTPDAKTFFPATKIRRGDLAAVLFEVSNLGTAPTPEWQFEAWLPIESSTFHSGVQPAIPVGGSVRFILGFSGLYSPGGFGPGGEFKATIRVDPTNVIQESNENNNRAEQTLPVVSD